MKSFLIMACVVSYWAALGVLALHTSGCDRVVAAGVFATCGTVALAGVALLERLTMVAPLLEKITLSVVTKGERGG